MGKCDEESKARVQSTYRNIEKLLRVQYLIHIYVASMCSALCVVLLWCTHVQCALLVVAESYVASMALCIFFWHPDFPGGGIARPDGPSSSERGRFRYGSFCSQRSSRMAQVARIA